MYDTWRLIPLSKWVITPDISGLTLLIPFIIGVITHLLSGMSHQVVMFFFDPLDSMVEFTPKIDYPRDKMKGYFLATESRKITFFKEVNHHKSSISMMAIASRKLLNNQRHHWNARQIFRGLQILQSLGSWWFQYIVGFLQTLQIPLNPGICVHPFFSYRKG